MELLGYALLIIGGFFTVLGLAGIATTAKQESFLSFFLVILIPPYLLYFVATRRERTSDSFYCLAKGGIFLFVARFLL